MQTSKCNELIERARMYERFSKKQYHAEGGGETEVWYETIHHHFEEQLLPEIKNHGDELFIEYWPARFAIDRERELRQGNTDDTFYKYEYGSYATGYVCVTSRKIYFVVLDKLTKLFPLHKASLTGFLLDALAKQINRLRPIPGDHSRTLTPTQIYSNSFASGHDENERTKLTTAVGTWELFDHFVDQKGEMYTAIECLCNGAFNALRPKWHVTKRPPTIPEAELLRRINKRPGLSLLPATPDPIRAERGARLLDLHYLAAQVAGQGGGEVEADLAHAAAARPHDVQLNKLRNVFAGIRHLLDRCTDEAEVLDTLHLRIDRLPELAELYNRSVGRLQHPYFRSWHSLPDKPHPALVRTIEIGNLHDPSSLGNEMLAYIWGHQPNTLITGGNDGVIRVWNLLSATIINSFTAFQLQPEDSARAVRIKQLLLSPDGSALLAVTSSKQLKAWNTGDWSLRFHIEAEDGIDDCAFSPNGAYFAYRYYRSNAIRVCDSGTGERIQHLPSYTGLTLSQGDEVISFRWGPSSNWMVLSVAEGGGFDNRVIGINVQSGEELFAFYCFDPHHFEIAPSGDSIFVHSGANPSLRVWSLAEGDWAHTTIERSDYGGWGISPSGKLVATGSKDGQILVFETRSGKLRYSLFANAGQARSCTFSPDGKYLLSRHEENRLALWDLARADSAFEIPKYFLSAGKDARKARSCVIVNAIPVSATLVVINGDHDAAMLDIASGEISPRYTTRPEDFYRRLTSSSLDELQYLAVDHCAVSADGKRLLLMDCDSWAVFDTANLTRTYSVENAFRQLAYIRACALSADNRWVAVAVDNILKIWDLSTNQFSSLAAKTTIQSCTFDPKSQWVVFASGNIALGEPEFQIYNLYTKALHPFGNPHILTQTFHLRERRPALDEWGYIWNCTATSDGTRILAAHRQGVISVWDVKSLGLVQFWQAHNTGYLGRVACRAMPDGKTVLTTGSDGAVRLWEVDTGKCLSAMQTEGILEDCAVFPDGKHVVAVGEAGVHWLEVIGL